MRKQIALAFGISVLCAVVQSGFADTNLSLFSSGWPRAGYFRGMEKDADTKTYAEWAAVWSQYDGIVGKVESENITVSANVLPYFKQFKIDYPDKFAVVHYSGRERDPRQSDMSPFFAGHWLHYEGCEVLEPIDENEIWLEVSDASRFTTNAINSGSKVQADDITLCPRNPDGTPDWLNAEEVILLEIDTSTNPERIKVLRGQYGTTPRAFETGAYAAAHMYTGPWGGLSWQYNWSTEGPRDANGKNCIDVMVDLIVAKFEPGGDWSTLDGVEFDVINSLVSYSAGGSHRDPNGDGNGSDMHLADCDGDGVEDDGYFNGINTYGVGNALFIERLFHALEAKGKLCLVDAWAKNQSRVRDFIHGVEQEGMPGNQVQNFLRWSQALNNLNFWHSVSAEPNLSYVAYKEDNANGAVFRWNLHRLTVAGALFTDSPLMCRYWPDSLSGDSPDWDELDKGLEETSGWLGQPVGEAIHLAAAAPDELNGNGLFPVNGALIDQLESNNAVFAIVDGVLKVEAASSNQSSYEFTIPAMPYGSDELFIDLEAKADAMEAYPAYYVRDFEIGANGFGNWRWVRQNRVHDLWSRYTVQFADTVHPDTGEEFKHNGNADTLTIAFRIQGSEPIYIRNLSVHDAPEIVYREYEKGAVIANLSESPYTFSMATHLPGNYHHIQGSPEQDPGMNDGTAVGEELVVGPKDAVLLWKPAGDQLLENIAQPGAYLRAVDGLSLFDLSSDTLGKVQWKLVPAAASGWYYLESDFYSGQRLRALSPSQFSLSSETGPALEWRIMPAGEGLYFLENGFYTNQVLTSDDGANGFSLSSIGAALDGSKWRLTAAPSWLEALGLVEGPSGDDDKDGESNLLEYGLGGDPLNPAILAEQPALQESAESGFDYIYLRRIGGNLDYQVEHSTDLKVWNDAEYEVTGQNGDRGDGYEYIINHLPEASESKQFIRLRIEER